MPSGWPEDAGPKPPCPPAPASLSAQGSREPGEVLPRKLKQVLRREFWSSFESLLTQGTEVRWLFALLPSVRLGPGVCVCAGCWAGCRSRVGSLPHCPQLLEGELGPCDLALGPSPSFPVWAFSSRGQGRPTASVALGSGQAWWPAHIHSCPEHSWAQRQNLLFQ